MPDELLELPYNASDSRHSLHNGNGGGTLLTGSNGMIIVSPGATGANCDNGYYQPVDTGQSDMVKIDVPLDVTRDEPRFPKEKLKTLYGERFCFQGLLKLCSITTTPFSFHSDGLPQPL